MIFITLLGPSYDCGFYDQSRRDSLIHIAVSAYTHQCVGIPIIQSNISLAFESRAVGQFSSNMPVSDGRSWKPRLGFTICTWKVYGRKGVFLELVHWHSSNLWSIFSLFSILAPDVPSLYT